MPVMCNGFNAGSLSVVGTIGGGQLNKYEIDGNGAYVVDSNGGFVIADPKTPPELTADTSSNTVDNDIVITFTDDIVWRTAISSIKIGTTKLTETTDYVIGAGTITLKPSGLNSLLTTSGDKSVVVVSFYYSDATVTQTINAGADTKLSIKTQPTAPATNGGALAQQPAIYILDKYNNITSSSANVVATVGAGTWTVGGTTTKSGSSGTATFTDLTATAGSSVTGATITFTSSGLTSITSNAFNIPEPVPVWSEVRPAGDADKAWYASSTSADGTKLLVSVGNGASGRVYYSSNSGTNWSELRPAGDADKDWRVLDMSDDGSVMIAGVYGGRMYISTNTGSNWSEVQPSGDSNEFWHCGAMSSDGSHMLIGNSENELFLSTNTGTSWTNKAPTTGFWRSCDVSDDGSKMIAVTQTSGKVYISTNNGANWAETQPAGATTKNWKEVSMSSDGTKIVVSAYGGRVYYTSNTGTNWSEIRPNGDSNINWIINGIDSTGNIIIAGVSGGRIYKSINAGTAWAEEQPAGASNLAWSLSSTSEDAGVILLGVNTGRLYVYK